MDKESVSYLSSAFTYAVPGIRHFLHSSLSEKDIVRIVALGYHSKNYGSYTIFGSATARVVLGTTVVL